jgi:hypothetical protein
MGNATRSNLNQRLKPNFRVLIINDLQQTLGKLPAFDAADFAGRDETWANPSLALCALSC